MPPNEQNLSPAPSGDRATIVCIYCGRAQDVSLRAQSITCKFCNKHLKLKDEAITRYEARRGRVLEALPVRAVSEGTFYVWIELPEGLTAERLLTEHRLALAPGEGFGPAGKGWARISLAVSDDVVEVGLGRLLRALG